MSDWDNRFLNLAHHVATWSKDPSTKVGAVIVDPTTRHVVSMGFNGFVRGIRDDDRLHDRAKKYPLIAHAERNALDQAEQSVRGMTMYASLLPCQECCKSIIQRGIKRVYACRPTPEQYIRWGESMVATARMLGETDIELTVSEAPLPYSMEYQLLTDALHDAWKEGYDYR